MDVAALVISGFAMLFTGLGALYARQQAKAAKAANRTAERAEKASESALSVARDQQVFEWRLVTDADNLGKPVNLQLVVGGPVRSVTVQVVDNHGERSRVATTAHVAAMGMAKVDVEDIWNEHLRRVRAAGVDPSGAYSVGTAAEMVAVLLTVAVSFVTSAGIQRSQQVTHLTGHKLWRGEIVEVGVRLNDG